MKRQRRPSRLPLYLGIEAGGTRTTAMIAAADGATIRQIEAGPANLRLLDDPELRKHFLGIAKQLPAPDAIAIGMAGARTDTDRKRIRAAAASAWPGIPCHATNDLETALMAAEPPRAGHRRGEPTSTRAWMMPRVLVLSGTGSCCFGRGAAGKTAKFGGWGHIIGDKGSGYEIGLRALKAVVYYFDCDGQWSPLGQRLLRRLQLNEPNDLIPWVQDAGKMDIAALAVEVFKAAAKRDPIATDILKGATDSLARDAVGCAGRLVEKGTPVQFVLAGSVLLKQPAFMQAVSRKIAQLWKGAVVSPLKQESVRGAVALARQMFPASTLAARARNTSGATLDSLENCGSARATALERIGSIALSPTEQRNPRSMNLDRLSIDEAVRLMLREDEMISPALMAARGKIAKGVALVTRSFRQNGRLFYVGAGTSGRLGVLDASECPPTFRTDPEMVQGIIAGGQRALWEAVEGAEDDPAAGARAIEYRGVNGRDTVVGIAASGRTPFVWGALREAKRRGAATVLLCFNPNVIIPRADRPTLVITPAIGPEILTGSTRLKSGTATKLILNIFTTLAMVRIGKVLGNLMIDVKASNIKLRDRAVRIVRELAGVDYPTAEAALLKSQWKIKAACARLKR
jgi:N-acetylmuramic acid 6-phosphate etherase